MKKGIVYFMLLAFLFFIFPSFSEELELEVEEPIEIIPSTEEEELEELFDFWGYQTPLYGIFQTGDEIPIEIIFMGLIGILCLILCFILKKYHT